MTLARTDQVILSVGIEPTTLDKVKPDLPVTLTSQLTGRKPIEGKVKRVGAAIDMKTRLVPTVIEVPAGGALAGETFKAGIVVGKFQGWVVPRDAVKSGSKGPFIFQVDEGHAKRVLVNVLGSVGKTSIIDGDIDSQKEIILAGNYQVDDGDAVKAEEAAPEEEEEED
jgi:multidrug efflux pump subunit AcrA (membrane-fusion protein)